MAGLIAGHMLRRHKPEILESSNDLPKNHSALLRFRSDSVAKATAIPFKKVFVRKGVVGQSSPHPTNQATLADINAYADKVSGAISERSIGNLDSCDRLVAPDNFLAELSSTCPAQIHFGQQVDELTIASKPKDEVWISTIPMPVMMKLVGWENAESKFEHRKITTVVATISRPLTTAYQTIYLPYKEWGGMYRVSIHGSQLIMESVGGNFEVPLRLLGQSHEQACICVLSELFGINASLVLDVEVKVQPFGKMVSVDDYHRKAFIQYLTDRHNIYSLGRFATWRPILLDDVVNDIEVIERLMKQSPYDRKKY